ncbi:hypothetical protein DVH05_000909 [Phytophthora capsici]|nr:hypothetical protein DVH05_000909 [Phytophthora capsici]
MREATKVYKKIEVGASVLESVTRTVRLHGARLHRITSPTLAGESNVTTINVETRPKARVAYVRLRRQERGNVVVLSSEEKYTLAKSVLEPVLSDLQGLSSVDFYKELKKWESIVKTMMGKRTSSPAKDASGTDTDNENPDFESTGSDEPIDLAELELMEHSIEDEDLAFLERKKLTLPSPATLTPAPAVMTLASEELASEHPPKGCPQPTAAEMPLSAFAPATYAAFEDTSLSQISLGDLDISENSQRIIDEVDDAAEGKKVDATSPKQSASGVELNIPKPVRGNARKKRRQNWSAVAAMPRYAVIEYPQELTATVSDVITWANNTPRLKDVADVLEKYPCIMNEQTLRGRSRRVKEITQTKAKSYCYSYIIPEDFVISLQAALDYFRSRQFGDREAKKTVVDLTCSPDSAKEKTLAVWVTPELEPFLSDCVCAMTTFYRIKKTCASWVDDVSWILQDWSKVTGRPVELFALETGSNGNTAHDARQRLAQLASDVMSTYLKLSLQSKVQRRDSNMEIAFDEVVGFLADDRWLNDAIISYSLAVMSENQKGVHVLSSLVVKNEKFPTPPPLKLFSMEFIVLPINEASCHWILIVVTVERHGVLRAHIYDPMMPGVPKRKTEMIWTSKFLPYLQEWHSQSAKRGVKEEYPFPACIELDWVSSPRQPDGCCCGVMVIALAYSFIHGGRGFINDAVTKDVVKVMRLRLLWVILCTSLDKPADLDVQKEATEIDKQLTRTFVKASKKIWN